MKLSALIVYVCDHPGCHERVEVADEVAGPTNRFHTESGWVFQLEDTGSQFPRVKEDFCPEHGRCSWCHTRQPRSRLSPGRGECEGQLICATCIIEREA